MYTLRSLALSFALVALCAVLAALLPGCGGGNATAEEIAQHDADMQTAALLDRKTIQPVACAASVACTR